MTLAKPRTSVSELLGQLAEQLPAPQDTEVSPVWGNSDVLIDQWRGELGDKASEAMLLGIRIRRIGMLIDRLLIEDCTALGIKYDEFMLLMALRRIGEPYALRPTDILRMHSVTSGTATYRIDKLTSQDLAERMNDPNDRRSYLIRLTPRGKKTVDAVLARTDALYREKLAAMSGIPEGFKTLEAGLRLFEACLTPEEG
ncbi:MarR family transcriptional regulator [Mitsuaria sp. CC2]|jgi:DNA-binding MarR family transcriptional regulator|uniref:MarR family winged helix-turn-helix transcriptional regulator n=1 Tax=Mitsuaria sp. CC2 TaxID=3029186 RepID=UPI003B8CE77D